MLCSSFASNQSSQKSRACTDSTLFFSRQEICTSYIYMNVKIFRDGEKWWWGSFLSERVPGNVIQLLVSVRKDSYLDISKTVYCVLLKKRIRNGQRTSGTQFLQYLRLLLPVDMFKSTQASGANHRKRFKQQQKHSKGKKERRRPCSVLE